MTPRKPRTPPSLPSPDPLESGAPSTELAHSPPEAPASPRVRSAPPSAPSGLEADDRPTRARKAARGGSRPVTEIKFSRVLEGLAAGLSARAACSRAGLSRSTWDGLSRDPARAQLIQQAVDQGLAALEARVLDAATIGDWRAAVRLLEQRDPAQWSARARVELAGRVVAETQAVPAPDERITRLLADPEKAQILFDLLDQEELAEAAAKAGAE